MTAVQIVELIPPAEFPLGEIITAVFGSCFALTICCPIICPLIGPCIPCFGTSTSNQNQRNRQKYNNESDNDSDSDEYRATSIDNNTNINGGNDDQGVYGVAVVLPSGRSEHYSTTNDEYATNSEPLVNVGSVAHPVTSGNTTDDVNILIATTFI